MTVMQPPTNLEYLPEPAPSQWPKVIGIIEIVFGALGALGGCAGAASLLFLGAIMGMMPEEGQMGMAGVTEWKAWLVGLSLVGLGLGVLLLVAGIAVVQRGRHGSGLSVAWAVFKIVFVIANAGVSYQVNRAQFEAMQEDPNLAQIGGGFMEGINLATTGLGVIWGLALPIFIIVWFARGKVRAEVQTWGAGMVGATP